MFMITRVHLKLFIVKKIQMKNGAVKENAFLGQLLAFDWFS